MCNGCVLRLYHLIPYNVHIFPWFICWLTPPPLTEMSNEEIAHIHRSRVSNTCCHSKCPHQVISADTGCVYAFICCVRESQCHKTPPFWPFNQWGMAVSGHRLVAQCLGLCLWERSGRRGRGVVTDTFRYPTSLCGDEKLHSQLLGTKAASTVTVGPTDGWLCLPACLPVSVCVFWNGVCVYVCERNLYCTHCTEAGMEAKTIRFLFSQRCKGRTVDRRAMMQLHRLAIGVCVCVLILNSFERMHVQPAQHWQAAMRA